MGASPGFVCLFLCFVVLFCFVQSFCWACRDMRLLHWRRAPARCRFPCASPGRLSVQIVAERSCGARTGGCATHVTKAGVCATACLHRKRTNGCAGTAAAAFGNAFRGFNPACERLNHSVEVFVKSTLTGSAGAD